MHKVHERIARQWLGMPGVPMLALLLLLGMVHGLFADRSIGLATRLYGDRRARNVGDLLTVVVVEESAAKRGAQHSTDKDFNMGATFDVYAPMLDGATPGTWTNFNMRSMKVSGNRKFQGKGNMENEEKLSGSIAVHVREILPNGNMLIEGRRSIHVQKDTLTLVLTGTVRPEDVLADNTVRSTQVADASIRYDASGSLAQTQKKGMIPRLIDWLNPF